MVPLINFNLFRLIAYIVIYYLYSVCLVRFSKFKNIASKLEDRALNEKSQFSSEYIYKYERKIAKLFRIKKCLISSICLFYLFNKFGIKCQIKIGINKLNVFSSHAWIETESDAFLKDPQDRYKIIREF